MHRFYCPDPHYKSQINVTGPSEIHHLKNVLRLKENDAITVFNGKGKEAVGTIMHLNSENCIINVEKVRTVNKNGLSLILACAIPKKGKFETIVEKATELGVNEIIPIITKRTEVVYKGGRILKKLSRFQTIAINAAKQCRRSDVPLIHAPTKFKPAIEQLSRYTTIIIPGLIKKSGHLIDILPKGKNDLKISVFIGPEGDFTKQEYDFALKAGALPVSLGATVLKVETAAIAAIAGIKLFYPS